MAQISRPFQIVLVAFVLFALAWFAVLHRPGSASTTGGSSPSVASSAGGSSAHPAAATHTAHIVVPTRANAKPHTVVVPAKHGVGGAQGAKPHTVVVPAKHGVGGAQGTKSHTVVVPAKHGVGGAQGTKSHTVAVPTKHGVGHARGTETHVSHATVATGTTAASILHHLTTAEHLSFVVNLLDPALKAEIAKGENIFISSMESYLKPASQATVAAELHHGKTVLLLFLNPSSYDDDATAIETVAAAHDLGHTVSVHFALANQVNSFGSITQDIQVYQTPTLLIVTPKRQVTTLTGLTDDYSIKQAVAEARG
jgi:hypothetical protein